MTREQTIVRAGEILCREAGGGAQVILFGSTAGGTADVDSDLDFVVIQPEVDHRHEEMVRLRRSLREVPAPIDVLVYSRDEARAWGEVEGTAIYDALHDGTFLSGG